MTMLRITVLQRKVASSRIVSYKIRTDDGRTIETTPEDLKRHIEDGQILVTNMTLTSNGRLVKSFRGHKAVKKDQQADFHPVKNIHKQVEPAINNDVQMFEQFEIGTPFSYRLNNIDNSEWKQAIFLGKQDDKFYFLDEQSPSVQGFSTDFLNRQKYFKFRTDDNDPVKVQMLLSRMSTKATK